MANVETGTGTSNAVLSLARGSSPSDPNHVTIQVPPNGDEGIIEVQNESSQTRSGDGDNNTTNDAPPYDQVSSLPVRPVSADDLFENVRRALSMLDRFSFDLTVTDIDIRIRSNNHPQGRHEASAPAGSNVTPDQHQAPPGNASAPRLQWSVSGNQQPPAADVASVVPAAQPDREQDEPGEARDQQVTPPPEQGERIRQNNGGSQAAGAAAAAAASAEPAPPTVAAAPDNNEAQDLQPTGDCCRCCCCCGTRTRRRGAPGNNQPAGDAATGHTTGPPATSAATVAQGPFASRSNQEPVDQQATGDAEQRDPRSGRLKITVAAEKAAADEDKEYLLQMRGWLMAVAALFVQMTFQAILQPPQWMKPEWYYPKAYYEKHRNDGNPASSPAVAPSPGEDAITFERHHWRAFLYLISNAIAFATSLLLLLVLLLVRSRRILLLVQILTSFIAALVAVTFVLGCSESWRITFATAIAGVVTPVVYFSFLFFCELRSWW